MKRLITTTEADQKFPGFIRSFPHANLLRTALEEPNSYAYTTLLMAFEGFSFSRSPQGTTFWNIVETQIRNARELSIRRNLGTHNPINTDVFDILLGTEVVNWRDIFLDMILVDEYDFKQFEKDDDDDF